MEVHSPALCCRCNGWTAVRAEIVADRSSGFGRANDGQSSRRVIMDWLMIAITVGLFFASAFLITFCDYLEKIK